MRQVDLDLFDRRPETLSVSEVCGEIRELLELELPSLWVAGEVQRLRRGRGGHAYFELIEKGPADEIVAKLDAVIWRRDLLRIERLLGESDQELAEGREMRCRANLDLYPPFGRLQLVVREVDPVFALGTLEARRRKTLQALATAGLLERNKALPLPLLPLTLALVTARESAAYHDFVSTLRESGYGFRVVTLDVAVQGRAAERQVASAVRAAGRLEVAAVALIRGGGSRTDLAAFDSRRIAEAVARCPLPVLTGLGHQIDEAIADRVAHTALTTPTKVAEFLVDRVAAAEEALARTRRRLAEVARSRLSRAAERVRGGEAAAARATVRLAAARVRLQELVDYLGRAAGRMPPVSKRRLEGAAERLLRAAPAILVRRSGVMSERGQRLLLAARGRLAAERATLAGLERLARDLAPARLLERGYSITRDTRGRVLRDAREARGGERITTRLHRGRLSSRVEVS